MTRLAARHRDHQTTSKKIRNTLFPETKNLEFSQIESELLEFWETEKIFEECVNSRSGAENFTFFEGPPTANGRPGIHHVLGRTIKDVFCRYKTLKGFQVMRKAGWDTHGLPVEIEVEKALGLDGREQVESFGIAEFNRACRESVQKYKKDWDELTKRIGYWVDLDDPYVTYENNYIESVWALVKRIHERGLLYKGHKIQWYSPGTGTVLSSHEVSLGYKEVDDPSVYVRFKLKNEQETFLLAWTTTPWTLISNVALAVGPDIEYSKIRLLGGDAKGQQIILATARLDKIADEYEVVATYRGAQLVGHRYERLYALSEIDDAADAWRVVEADYVSTDDGTGIVHQAPAFGAEDYEVCRREGLPMANPMGPDGRFLDGTPLVAGEWFKDANKIINRDLRDRKLLYKQENYLHNYPHDWRKGTPLMSYPVESWFVRTTEIKDRMVALNKTINWYPPSIRDGRFGNWLENNIDWALSRKRYWGTPLPVWVSDTPGSEYFEVIGSVAELREKCGDMVPPTDELDLHRPYVDDYTWPAPDGGTMRRVGDVLDVWFDSGAMPFAQWHYPFENKDIFAKNFPADFICEGVDQTRGWFYTLHAIASLVEDQVSFKNCVVNGLILDEKGEKMSKSKGNTVDPFETVATHGADVVRWYMMSNSPPWDNMKFSMRGLAETRNKFFGTLENVYRFMASYANIDEFTHGEKSLAVAARSELDRWIISRLHSCLKEVDDAFDNYDATRAARSLEMFVDELSNWYIRRSRPRFWAAKKSTGEVDFSDEDKLSAYATTFECLTAVATAMSPIAPFFSDWLYRSLAQGSTLGFERSVHLANFPTAEASLIDETLENRMGIARSIVGLALLLRNKESINVRRPLSRVLVVVGGKVDIEVVESIKNIVLDEINVHDIEYIEDSSEIVKRSAKANFASLGRRLGKKMKAAAAVIAAFNEEQITQLATENHLEIELDGELIALSGNDVEILSEEMGDWSVAQEGSVTIALDTKIDDELRAQGLAREFSNRVQSLRKKADLRLTDRIKIEFNCSNQTMVDAVDAHLEFIQTETLAKKIAFLDLPRGEFKEIFDVDDFDVTIAIDVDNSVE
ncbi:MAG: isoleucine--tRNA ligase [Gammaproteobacteria bacterium]